jgi:F-type H+-transporting ATPase subunit b
MVATQSTGAIAQEPSAGAVEAAEPVVVAADPAANLVDGDALDEIHEEIHDEAHGEMPPLLSFDFGSAIWNLFIFLLTLLILGVFVWPQILSGLQAREDKIQEDIQGAERANAEAKASLATYQQQLADAQAKIQEMMADARKNADRVGAGIVEQAKADAERQRERALSDIEAAKSVAISQLAGQTSELAMALARQVVGRELNPQDHADLIRQSLERLPSNN